MYKLLIIQFNYKITCLSQYTLGLGHPVGGWQAILNGSPSWASTQVTDLFLNSFNSAFKTITDLDVAVPQAFSAKHWYCPT